MVMVYVPSGMRAGMQARTVRAIDRHQDSLAFALSWSEEASQLTAEHGIDYTVWDLCVLDGAPAPAALSSLLSRLVCEHAYAPTHITLHYLDEQARALCDRVHLDIHKTLRAATRGSVTDVTLHPFALSLKDAQ